MKIQRDLKKYAEVLGLECLGLEDGSGHFRLMFKNKDGHTYGVTLHKSKNEPPLAQMKKMKNNLKRFSESAYHLLPVRKHG